MGMSFEMRRVYALAEEIEKKSCRYGFKELKFVESQRWT